MRIRGLIDVLGRSLTDDAPRETSGDGRGGGVPARAPDPGARRFDRVDTQLRCWCEGEGVTYFARMANFGAGGVFVRTGAPLEVGSEARVRFGPRGGAHVAARARVVWTRTDGMGLRFDDLDEVALEVIRGIADNGAR